MRKLKGHGLAEWLNVRVDFPLLQRLAHPIKTGAVRYPGLKIHERASSACSRSSCMAVLRSAAAMRNRPRLRLADEIGYIQRRAAAHDGRVVTFDQIVLFSTETGDAWLLDPSDHLAACLARDGDPESIAFEETDTSFQLACPGSYRLDGPAFVDTDRQSHRVSTIIGYPTRLFTKD